LLHWETPDIVVPAFRAGRLVRPNLHDPVTRRAVISVCDPPHREEEIGANGVGQLTADRGLAPDSGPSLRTGGMPMSRRHDTFDRDVAAARRQLIEQLRQLSKSFSATMRVSRPQRCASSYRSDAETGVLCDLDYTIVATDRATPAPRSLVPHGEVS
jgi:hypothetical protein